MHGFKNLNQKPCGLSQARSQVKSVPGLIFLRLARSTDDSEPDVAWSAARVMGVRIHFIETHVSQQFPPGVATQRKRGRWEGSTCLGRKTEWKRADNHQPMQLNCHIQRYPPADTFPRQDSDSVLNMQSMSRVNFQCKPSALRSCLGGQRRQKLAQVS